MVASILLAALWGAPLAVPQGEAPDFVTLGTVRIGGTDVPMRVPSGKGETFRGHYFEWHEGKRFETDDAGNRANLWRYVVDDEGRPADRILETGGWKDVIALYRRAQANLEKAPEWRIKVVVLARTTTINVDQNGVCVPRRGFLDDEEIARVREGLAQTKAMVEAYQDGRIKLVYDFEVDREEWWEDPQEFVLPRSPLQSYSRMLDSGERPGSRYCQDLWLVHPATLGSEWPRLSSRFGEAGVIASGSENDAFGSAIPYRGAPASFGGNGMVPRMVAAFCVGAWRAVGRDRERGFSARSLTDALTSLREAVSSEDWQDAVRPFDPERRRRALARILAPGPRTWAGLARPIADAPLGEEGTLVPWSWGPVYGAAVGGGAPVVTGALRFANAEPPWTRLGVPLVSVGKSVASPGVVGATVETVQDPEHGEVTQLTRQEREPIRVELVEPTAPAYAMWLRWEGNEPFGLAALRANGRPEEFSLIGGRFMMASLGSSSLPDARLSDPSDGKAWRRVVWRPKEIGAISRLELVTPPDNSVFEAPARPLRIWFTHPKPLAGDEASSFGPYVETAVPNPDSTDWYERALAASRAHRASIGREGKPSEDESRLLVRLLGDRNDSVALTAVRALASGPPKEAESRLADLARTSEPAIAEAALRALAKSGTPSAWLSVRQALQYSPYERARIVAARLLGQTGNPAYAGPLATLAARGWRTRVEAVEALAKIKGELAESLKLAFVQDPHPYVREAAIRLADLADSTARQRVLFYAANDPSDMVRGTAYRRLMGANDESLQKAGLVGLDDPSYSVRTCVLSAPTTLPTPLRRAAALKALHDPHPRIVELGSLIAEGLTLEWSDVAKVADSPDPAHEQAMLWLMNHRVLPLDAQRLERIRRSPWPSTQFAVRNHRLRETNR